MYLSEGTTIKLSDKIYLRNISINDADKDKQSWKWLNNKNITLYMNKNNVNNTPKKQEKFINKIIDSKKDLMFAICTYQDNEHIGNVGLHNINLEKKNSQFGILIGETKFHNLGIGTLVWKNVVAYGFNKLNLKSIYTKIFSENLPSLKIAKKVGFVVTSKYKKEILKDNKYYDRFALELSYLNWIKIDEKKD
tara:strand:+ start:1409 stop:1987 length:579 start_codon:yes stop_codon:yes gene_type:complete